MNIALSETPNAKFMSEDKTLVDCDVLIDGEPKRFTANKNDIVDHGRTLFAILMLDPSKIAPYEAPAEINSKSEEA